MSLRNVSAVQAADRALIVDTLPFSQQPDGSAWAARMQGFGSVLGFFMSVDKEASNADVY